MMEGPKIIVINLPFAISYRAQLGRLGGSRWGWVLQIKIPCHIIIIKNSGSPARANSDRGSIQGARAITAH
jgi:hypothetical protein